MNDDELEELIMHDQYFPGSKTRFLQIVRTAAMFASEVLHISVKEGHLYLHAYRTSIREPCIEHLIAVVPYTGPDDNFYTRPGEFVAYLEENLADEERPTTAAPLGYEGFPNFHPQPTVELDPLRMLDSLQYLHKIDISRSPLPGCRGPIWNRSELLSTDGFSLHMTGPHPELTPQPTSIGPSCMRALYALLVETENPYSLQAGYAPPKKSFQGKTSFVFLGEGMSVTLISQSRHPGNAFENERPDFSRCTSLVFDSTALGKVANETVSAVGNDRPILEIQVRRDNPEEAWILGGSRSSGQVVLQQTLPVQVAGKPPTGDIQIAFKAHSVRDALDSLGQTVQFLFARTSSRDSAFLNGSSRNRCALFLQEPPLTSFS